jgi:hypothetical protein
MYKTVHVMIAAALIALLAAYPATAQTSADLWRSFAERVDVGTELSVRMSDGRRFRATLIGLRTDAMLVQPKTRVPVPIQAVPFEQIVRLERSKSGIGAGKAVAIGVAAGVGAFFGVMAIILAVESD